jgi:eukaryotic-like serine/threonine-protein kinase
MPLSSGEQLGHYKILSMIGKGGMGEVYLGTDTRLGRSVAIKVSSREFNDRFEREARAISTLNHPNICTLYDVGPIAAAARGHEDRLRSARNSEAL